MAKPELSIIIVSYNTKDVTLNCLESIISSLKDSSLVYEIIVVDNASTDGSVNALKRYAQKHDRVRLIENKTNLGFGKGNNLAVTHAKGTYTLFLNSDTIVLDQAIEKLLTFYKSQRNFEFVGAKLLNKDLSAQPSCGPFYTLPIIFGALFLKGDYWGLTRSSPKDTTEIDWVSGACFITTREYFQKLDGFDKNIFMYMEEVDLMYRAKKLGYKTAFYPHSKFIHLGSASSGGRTYPIIQVYEGFIYFYKKHHNRLMLILLQLMLQLKAAIAWGLGKLTKNDYLVNTYEKAFKIASLD